MHTCHRCAPESIPAHPRSNLHLHRRGRPQLRRCRHRLFAMRERPPSQEAARALPAPGRRLLAMARESRAAHSRLARSRGGWPSGTTQPMPGGDRAATIHIPASTPALPRLPAPARATRNRKQRGGPRSNRRAERTLRSAEPRALRAASANWGGRGSPSVRCTSAAASSSSMSSMRAYWRTKLLAKTPPGRRSNCSCFDRFQESGRDFQFARDLIQLKIALLPFAAQRLANGRHKLRPEPLNSSYYRK